MFCDESKGFRKEGGGEGEEVAVRVGRELIHSFSSVPACSAHSASPSFSPSLLYFWKHLILVSQAQHAHEDSVYQALASYFSLLFMILKHKRVVQGEAELSTELLMHCVDIVDI